MKTVQIMVHSIQLKFCPEALAHGVPYWYLRVAKSSVMLPEGTLRSVHIGGTGV